MKTMCPPSYYPNWNKKKEDIHKTETQYISFGNCINYTKFLWLFCIYMSECVCLCVYVCFRVIQIYMENKYISTDRKIDDPYIKRIWREVYFVWASIAGSVIVVNIYCFIKIKMKPIVPLKTLEFLYFSIGTGFWINFTTVITYNLR